MKLRRKYCRSFHDFSSVESSVKCLWEFPWEFPWKHHTEGFHRTGVSFHGRPHGNSRRSCFHGGSGIFCGSFHESTRRFTRSTHGNFRERFNGSSTEVRNVCMESGHNLSYGSFQVLCLHGILLNPSCGSGGIPTEVREALMEATATAKVHSHRNLHPSFNRSLNHFHVRPRNVELLPRKLP